MASLTDVTVRSLKPPARGQRTYFDDKVRGFGVRVSQGGTKTFIILYGTKRRRVTLGTWPVVSLAKAREVARHKLAEVQLGADHARISYQSLKDSFLIEAKANTRPRTYDSYKWLLGRVDLSGDANAITPRMLTHETDKLAPSVKQHAIAVLKMMFRHGVRKGLLKSNAAEALTVRKSRPRKRVLSEEELKLVWQACPDTAYGTVVKLLILTGQRRSEIEHIVLKGDLATIPGRYVKNHRDHTFPVGKAAQGLLAKPRTWNGWSKSKKDLDKAINKGREKHMPPWTLHDLRRTFRTKWAELQLPREVAEKYINHVSGVQDPVEQIYDQHDYIPEMRKHIATYERRVLSIVK
ncbi:integrase family protein [Enhydrobacter sp.]|jgi:integrase|uniref:tyrosine-type recombinase/integrase n=1 Tax=Enhydrobacter sp. TaxID=1894999 RepID=UPI00261C3976|nr:integrase family protein [Enhydrobacter sp.]WIM10531.1 MAG: hypothetical protein OJF58_001487 [Enhydrobacter sp.]